MKFVPKLRQIKLVKRTEFRLFPLSLPFSAFCARFFKRSVIFYPTARFALQHFNFFNPSLTRRLLTLLPLLNHCLMRGDDRNGVEFGKRYMSARFIQSVRL